VHPGFWGSYLRACTFYAVLTGENPEEISTPETLVGQLRVPQKEADLLERAAWKVAGAAG
jgi:hypothetical protein